ncbi:MAG: glycerol kinase, partial [Aquiluna sp.]
AKNLESTGFGAGLLAGLGSGIWGSMDELRQLNPARQEFAPVADRGASYERWLEAVEVTSKF